MSDNDIHTVEGLTAQLASMVRERTAMPAVELYVEAADGSPVRAPGALRSMPASALAHPGLTDSKYGGPYPLPAGWDEARDPSTGAPLHLLAQWNFALLPKLDGYPDDGLLQVFLAEDADADLPWQIRYVPAALLAGVRAVDPQWPDEAYNLPFTGPNVTYKLCGEPVTSAMDTTDAGFEPLLDECLDLLGGDARDLYDEEYDEASDRMFHLLSADGHRLGGHPMFTQDDPRTWMDDGGELVMVAQINSIEFSMMLGDNGIGHVFMPAQALRERDFTKAEYQWDCY